MFLLKFEISFITNVTNVIINNANNHFLTFLFFFSLNISTAFLLFEYFSISLDISFSRETSPRMFISTADALNYA